MVNFNLLIFVIFFINMPSVLFARLEKNLPEQFEKVKIEEESAPAGGSEDDKKRQKRGGKGMVKAKKKDDIPKSIKLSRAPRGKKKSVTVVVGLSTFGKYMKFSGP